MAVTETDLRRRRLWLRPVGLGALVILLIGSVVSNVLLYRQASRTYRELQEVRLDPYGLGHRFAGLPSGPIAPNSIVVFLGDSRAEQWPAPGDSRFHFVNRGIDGQTTEQIRGRLDAHVLPLHPRVVVLQAGINDLKTIGIFPTRRNQTVAACKANLREIVSRCRNAGSSVIATTVFPTGPVPLQRRPYWSPQIDRAVEEVNEDIRSMKSDKVIVLDAWQILQENGRLRPGYAADTLHLTPPAYESLNQALKPLLDPLAPPPAQRGK
jgi:lysophospholipase L1-like esterase